LRLAKKEYFGVLARFGKFLVVVALVTTTGLHWAVLQSVAWTTMLADNLRTQSLTEAVTHTFDGNHPCCLCKAIAAGRKSEQKKEFTAPLQKLEFPPVKENFVLIAPSSFNCCRKQTLSPILSPKSRRHHPRADSSFDPIIV
jgi:hypothetical protein